MTDHRTVLIAGYFGYGNLGDEALLGVALTGLRNSIPSVRTIVVSGCPAETAALHSVEAVPTDPSVVLAALEQCDALVLGPGGILHDARSPRRRRQAGLSYFFALTRAAVETQVPVGVFNVGIGPIESRSAERYVTSIIRSATLVNPRDPSSGLWLSARGLTNHHTSADIAWMYSQPEPAPPDHKSPPYVAVSVRDWPGHAEGSGVQKTLARSLRTYLDEHPDHRVIVVPMHHRGATSDVKASQLLATSVGSSRATVATVSTPAEAYGVLAKAQSTIAMRLHASVFSIGSGVPTVGLAYTEKVAAPYDAVGHPELALSLASPPQAILSALDSAQRWDGRRIAEAVESNSRSAATAVDELAGFVGATANRQGRGSSSATRWWLRRQQARAMIICGRSIPNQDS